METACTYFDLLLWILVVNRTLVHLFSDSLRLECFIPAKNIQWRLSIRDVSEC